MSLRTVSTTRYVTPLREGGSLPAIVEADDDGLYVLKFRGAGQGARALVAELIAGEIARALGLPVPEIVLVELDADLARTEPDPEIQQLIRASQGLNLALDYLPGAVMFDPVAEQPAAALASEIVWFDAYVSNLDRTCRNTNLLVWHRQLQLIDHGAALYFHHSDGHHSDGHHSDGHHSDGHHSDGHHTDGHHTDGHHTYGGWLARATEPFALVRDHVLLPLAAALEDADARLAPRLDAARLAAIVALVPDAWLTSAVAGQAATQEPAQRRRAYVDYLVRRLEGPREFVREALRARAA